jgi:hypothetical protein
MYVLEMLDLILRVLSKETTNKLNFKNIETQLRESFELKNYVNELRIEKAIEKLVEEKYVTELKVPFNNELTDLIDNKIFYEISYKGQFFISTGGYVGIYDAQKEDKKRIIKLEEFNRKSQWFIIILTAFLVVFSAIQAFYYTNEIYKYFFVSVHNCVKA